jgi:sialate O-acetylesterase
MLTVSLWLAAPGLSEVRADVKLPKVFGSHMVLQRERPLTIWGWAAPGEQVTVRFEDIMTSPATATATATATPTTPMAIATATTTPTTATATVTADAQGNWQVELPAVKADGKTHHLTVSAKKKIVLEDILIGDVWLGSGQSNMEMGLTMCQKGKEEAAAANYPKIRLLLIPKTAAKEPAKDVNSQWMRCQPDTVAAGGWGGFSGVLYYFGLRLHKDLDVPIGLIESAWGGSPIEPWTITGEKGGEMYNGMIAPVKPLAIRGVIWYQGETNAFQRNGLKYYGKMKDLIQGWRKVWGYDFPFYFVQIAPCNDYPEGELPALWEAQVASLKIPRTGMAVTTDLVHNLGDIHPINKLDVGRRLALWALAKEYGKKDLVYSGPLYKSMKIEGGKVRLSFAYAGGLKSRDGRALSEFTIAAADGKFVPAVATIDGDTVVVEARGVAEPTQVQFGWRPRANPNLVNGAGLPASPFQTNHWQGGTGE